MSFGQTEYLRIALFSPDARPDAIFSPGAKWALVRQESKRKAPLHRFCVSSWSSPHGLLTGLEAAGQFVWVSVLLVSAQVTTSKRGLQARAACDLFLYGNLDLACQVMIRLACVFSGRGVSSTLSRKRPRPGGLWSSQKLDHDQIDINLLQPWSQQAEALTQTLKE